MHNMDALKFRCIYILHQNDRISNGEVFWTVCFCQRHLRDICVMFIVLSACVLLSRVRLPLKYQRIQANHLYRDSSIRLLPFFFRFTFSVNSNFICLAAPTTNHHHYARVKCTNYFLNVCAICTRIMCKNQLNEWVCLYFLSGSSFAMPNVFNTLFSVYESSSETALYMFVVSKYDVFAWRAYNFRMSNCV